MGLYMVTRAERFALWPREINYSFAVYMNQCLPLSLSD
jgi:hypothetical protein